MADEKKIQEATQFVDEFLNNMLKGEIINRIAWIINAVPLSDLRDVAIGYVIGVTLARFESYGLMNQLTAVLDGKATKKLDTKDYQNLMAILRDKLPKIVEKVEKEFCE